MGRLILVLQYPAKLRYQEWWWSEFPQKLKAAFSEVIILGDDIIKHSYELPVEGNFAPVDTAIQLELEQVKEYLSLELQEDDILLLNDISYPGIFANVLFHKEPKKCFAICHATSLNRFDYFERVRSSKWGVEKSTAKLFDKVIVASKYHAEKLDWTNVEVLPLPESPHHAPQSIYKEHFIVSVARPGVQKRDEELEALVEKEFNTTIVYPNATDWNQYYGFLATSKIMLITSKEETFGYQVLDAIEAGCIPIAPNKFSYPELLPQEYLYNDVEDMLNKIQHARDKLIPPLVSKVGEQSFYFYHDLVKLMKA